MSDSKKSINIYSLSAGGVSASARRKGSVTVEAALAVPIFFLAVVSLLYLMEIMAIRTSVRAGLQWAGKQAMQNAYAVRAVIPADLEGDVVQAAGAGRLDRSIIVGGSSGIHCEGSYLSPGTGIGKIKASYKVRLPIPLFAAASVSCEETMQIKAWTGYEKNMFGNNDDETVYVTETGLVYHRDYQCTYLKLSIHMVQASEVDTLRNDGGGKYYPCEHCRGQSFGGVYITDTGNRYHTSLTCSGLKRTIYAVPLSEAVGKGACSRCG